MNLRILLISILLMSVTILQAQTYNFEVTQGSYEDLESSISLNGDMTWDDPDFLIPIGFDFNFFDTITETLLLTGLGSDLLLSLDFENTIFIMVPFGADVIDRAYDMDLDESSPGSQSTISYLLEGEIGSRILKIEWKNVGFYSELAENGMSNDFANFQFWLFEGSNNFEIHFGESSINYPDFSFDDTPGPLIWFDPTFNFSEDVPSENALILTGDPASPDLSSGPIDIDDAYLDGMVPNGTIYRFIKSTTSSNNQLIPNISIELFPIPAGDILNYSFNDFSSEIISITISNIAGQNIANFTNPTSPLNISSLNPGVYILTINTVEGMVSKKLIKR